MKRSVPDHSFAAAIALAVWIAILLKIINGGDQWRWMLHALIPGSVLTIVVTALLSRFWVARKKLPSFGTFIIVPFCAVFLISLLWQFKAFGWEMFTAYHWNLNPKVTLSGKLFADSLIGGICVFPAIAVVIYYHGRSKKHDPTTA